MVDGPSAIIEEDLSHINKFAHHLIGANSKPMSLDVLKYLEVFLAQRFWVFYFY